GHPFNDLSGYSYWSSSTDLASTTQAWTANMFNGGISSAVKAEGLLPAWPVRDAETTAPALSIHQGDMTTKATSLSLDGTVGAGATALVKLNGVDLGAPAVSGTSWGLNSVVLTPGANNITVTAADFCENQASATITVTQDSVAPALSINPVAARTNKKGHTLSGTVEAGATVEVTAGGQSIPVTVTGTTWSCPAADLKQGDN